MYRKIVWCYVFVLTLLDISLNTKLSAQGKSHGVTVHDSLIEGITFQEWGKESEGLGGRSGRRALAAGALQLWPPELAFGRRALAAAHALSVTLTNTANTTLHLASVAGTTPDFHASFFEAKTLPPQANTTFSVVYLGRREGPVSAHLYIHTSRGVHKYPVSAEGVASEWGVWPLVGVRVPLNASVEPLLTMHNPTDQTIQVSEVYSSGSWLGLVLPDGGASAPRRAWAVPPGATRALVRLRLAPAAPERALTAYVRIRANMTGGGLLLCVEARAVPPQEYVTPLQLRLRTRGSQDPPDHFDILAGNSAAAGVELEASVWAARCAATPPAPPAPPDPAHAAPTANGQSDKGTANGNGVKASGVYVSLLRPQLDAHAPPRRAAMLTLDYGRMWAGAGVAAGEGAGEGAGEARRGAWCAGVLRVGRAELPYSLRLLPGTLRLDPADLHFVTSSREDALREREVRVRNEFPVPVHITRIDLGPDVDKYFEVESLAGGAVAAGGSALVARVTLRESALPAAFSTHVTLRTNLSDYTLPLHAYSGRLLVEWEWPDGASGALRLGALGTSATRRVAGALRHLAPVALCIRSLALRLAGASLALGACGAWPARECRCVAPGARLALTLTVVAPAREGALGGALELWAAPQTAGAPASLTRVELELSAHAGRLHALPLHLYRAAPYAWSSAPLVLESSMELSMVVLDVQLPRDAAVRWEAPRGPARVAPGRAAAGRVLYAAERACAPRCYTGLALHTPDGAAWRRRARRPELGALARDAALQRARHALFRASAATHNFTLLVHTSRVLGVEARGAAWAWWPRLAAPRVDAGLAAVRARHTLTVRVRNPSRSHALVLQPVLAPPLAALAGEKDGAACPACEWSRDAFTLEQWRATRGDVSEFPADEDAGQAGEEGEEEEEGQTQSQGAHNASSWLGALLLAPDAELDVTLSFAPPDPAPRHAMLYLRNNLTIIEGVQLTGRGAYPSFELGGRRPGTNAPLLFEVNECGGNGGTVRRTVLARNTGSVAVRLRAWALAGQPCQARGFRLSPCAPLALQPNESRPLTLAFTPDYTLARVSAALTADSDAGRAAFLLAATAPARLLPRCLRAAPRPPWEPAARAAATLLAVVALALVLAAAALDAERELRRARQARPPPAARQPLDLRALAACPAPAPAPRRARRRRTPRRAPAPDPRAERRAFERWRAHVLRRATDTDERSSEDNEPDAPEDDLLRAEAPEPRDRPPALTDGYDADPETEDRPPPDDDADSTGSGSTSTSSSSPAADDRDDDHDDDRDDEDEQQELPDPDPAPPASGDSSPTSVAPLVDSPERPADVPPLGLRAHRSPRSERTRADADARSSRARGALGSRAHVRKDKASKRRTARPHASPARASPARPAPAVRWGASWSSVVAARPAPAAPLAPIGSDVRRRSPGGAAGPGTAGPGTAADHSLFYFNGDTHSHAAPDYSWRAPEPPAFTPARDFLEEPVSATSAVGAGAGLGAGAGVGAGAGGPGAVGSGAFRSLSSVWGGALEPRPAAAAWLWGYGDAQPAPTVRPPPGFGAPPRPVRPYDPFHSLAAIWAPGRLDWREGDDEPAN